MIAKHETESKEINSIGIGVQGTVDNERGLVIFASNIFWENVEVSVSVEKVFNLSFFLGQDSHASAWDDMMGTGKGYKNIASIPLETGSGCRMVLDRKLFHGG